MNNKKKNILLIITVVFLIVIVFGATYAYFVAQTGAGQSANVNITANTTDSLMFEVGKDLSININQQNFGEGAGNQSDSTTAKAILLANNKTNTASYNYYLYLNITKNEFVYTTEEQTPEILLQITKPDGTTLTSLEGLNYVTVGSTSGFDITTKKGPITIADSRLIEVLESNTTHKTEEEWQIGITFVNLDTNQQANTNKSFVSKVMIQKDPIPTISTLCKGQNMASCIKENYALDDKIYYHNESLANGAGDNSYRYAGANPDNFVCFGSDAETCPTDNLYRVIGVFGDKVKLIKYDYVTSELLGTDGDYQGVLTDESVGMPEEYLTQYGYKGTMKASEIGAYMYNYNGLPDHEGDNKYGSNDWPTSLLNTVNLNTNFLNNIGNNWSSKIATTTWNIGGMTWANGVQTNAKTAYDYELGANKIDKTYEAKVGLMYVSDYYYSAPEEYWTLPGYDTNGSWNDDYTIWTGEDYSKVKDENWMWMFVDWTIAPRSVTSYLAFGVHADGYVFNTSAEYGFPVRPSFSLVSETVLAGGSGSMTDPWRIN